MQKRNGHDQRERDLIVSFNECASGSPDQIRAPGKDREEATLDTIVSKRPHYNED